MPNVTLNALPAGTNNIGDVDIAEKTLVQISGTKNGSGDNSLVATPGAGYRLVVSAFVIQNESSTATTMQLINGTGGAGWRCLGQNQGDGLAMNLPAGRCWKLTENTALILNLSGANACGYSVSYYVEAI